MRWGSPKREVKPWVLGSHLPWDSSQDDLPVIASHPGQESKLVILPEKQSEFQERGAARRQPWRGSCPLPRHALPQLGSASGALGLPTAPPTCSSLFAFPPWLFCNLSRPRSVPRRHFVQLQRASGRRPG